MRHHHTTGRGHHEHGRGNGYGHHKGCEPDTLVLILDDRDHAGAVLVEGDFREEDSPFLDIVDGDLVLAMDNPPGHDFTAIVDGDLYIFQDWSGG